VNTTSAPMSVNNLAQYAPAIPVVMSRTLMRAGTSAPGPTCPAHSRT
jgi:hypothetical protein